MSGQTNGVSSGFRLNAMSWNAQKRPSRMTPRRHKPDTMKSRCGKEGSPCDKADVLKNGCQSNDNPAVTSSVLAVFGRFSPLFIHRQYPSLYSIPTHLRPVSPSSLYRDNRNHTRNRSHNTFYVSFMANHLPKIEIGDIFSLVDREEKSSTFYQRVFSIFLWVSNYNVLRLW